MKGRVLLVDDEEAIRSSLSMIFEYADYQCIMATNGPQALKLLEVEDVDLVILDVKMAQMDGLEVLRELKARPDAPPVIILSGHGNVKTAVEATKLGAFDFVEKPPDSDRLLLVARNALEQRKLSEENRRLKLSFDNRYRMVGKSAALDRVFDSIKRASPTNATVLITGESGVGKELVARAIHRNSARRDEAFVQVNCAAIPEELIESELFGHEKGSFTGATEKQIGKFELAHKGTIFLDEVGDMSLKTQAKVLRVLQEGEVERIGSQRTIEVDVRVIAATNKDLQEAIQRNEFREDLFFRLSVIPLRVPPLRERPEDIDALVANFVAQFASENNVRPRSFSKDAMDALRRQQWRGNIRELKNTIERLLIMSEGDEIRPEHLAGIALPPRHAQPPQDNVPSREQGAAVAPASDSTSQSATGTLKDFKETAERAFIVQKLRENRWNISQTATAIDTPRSNLYKKLEQYEITEEKDG